MQGVGADIIEIARISQAVAEWGEAFLRRVYTDLELSQCRGRPASLAARFAGKEAVYKLLGGSGKGIGWRDVEILSDSGGRPSVRFHGAAADYARTGGRGPVAISLSHSREYAIAVAIAEAGHSPQ